MQFSEYKLMERLKSHGNIAAVFKLSLPYMEASDPESDKISNGFNEFYINIANAYITAAKAHFGSMKEPCSKRPVSVSLSFKNVTEDIKEKSFYEASSEMTDGIPRRIMKKYSAIIKKNPSAVAVLRVLCVSNEKEIKKKKEIDLFDPITGFFLG